MNALNSMPLIWLEFDGFIYGIEWNPTKVNVIEWNLSEFNVTLNRNALKFTLINDCDPKEIFSWTHLNSMSLKGDLLGSTLLKVFISNPISLIRIPSVSSMVC